MSRRGHSMLLLVLTLGLFSTVIRPAYIATGAEGWADRPVGSSTLGQRPLADREGRVFAEGPEGEESTERIVSEPELETLPLAQLIDANHYIDTADSHQRIAVVRTRRSPFVTTIATDVQRSIADILGTRPGAIAVIEPGSGEVRALVATTYSQSGELQAFPAGSIFKPVVYGAALSQGTIGLDHVFEEEVRVGGIPNATGESCGGSIAHVIAISCNTSAVVAGSALDPEGFEALAAELGISGNREMQLVESSTLGSEFAEGDNIYSTAIGQFNVRLNALTAASLAATIANDGLRRPPTFTTQEVEAVRVLTKDHTTVIQEGMELAFSQGTASRALPRLESAALKTGTAQTGIFNESGDQVTHGWTIGYAPASNPTVAVAVFLQGDEVTSMAGIDAANLALEALETALNLEGEQ